ncbi:MAG: gluconate 2-dehydrogenase subunit 3 family protein [Saprospiraceae bacterium]|nr:gluconate 2-dehydrogenase subunit 3 family protein [Saprospiraceae bacterium]
MDRRKSLQYISTLMGASFISAELFITGCKPAAEKTDVSDTTENINFSSELALLSSIGEIILPASGKHPGFKAVNGGEMLVTLLNDCYTSEQQQMIQKGLKGLSDGEGLAGEIAKLDAAYFDATTPADQKPVFYGALKEAILLSYFTNEKVMTEVLSYVKVPGKHDGSMKVDPEAYTTVYGFGA